MSEKIKNDAVVTETAAETTAVETPVVAVETPTKPKRKNITPTRFIQVWEEVAHGLNTGSLEGRGVELVAARLGLKPASVEQKATMFRTKRGVPLTNMPRAGGARFDTDAALAELEAIRNKLTEVE